jgi:phenylpyruvate tautomerase PptA (4-oxalocrotonate tautomerase family)
MPLVRIDLATGRTPEAVRGIADAIHQAIVDVYGIPVRDRFQVITEHAGLGFERTEGVIVIQVFTQRGRTDEAKAALYRAIHDALAAIGVASEDVFIGYVENGPQDWSFGFGRAQYVTGELGVPALG